MSTKMKKLVSAVLVVLMCMTAAPLGGFVGLDWDFGAKASSETDGTVLVDDITYTFDETTGTLVFSGKGAIPDYAEYGSEGELSPFCNDTSIKSVVIGEGITAVGKCAFYGCQSLESVSFPSTLKSINDDAFAHCTMLNNIVIPNGVTTIGTGAFQHCEYADNIVIGCSVTDIGAKAFLECGVTSWRIPNSVKTIGQQAFYNHIETYTKFSVKYYGTQEQWNNITIGTYNFGSNSGSGYDYTKTYINTANKIGDSAYYEVDEVGKVLYVVGSGDTYDYSASSSAPFVSLHEKITAVSVGEGITKVGNGLFYACDGAKEAYLPSTLKAIGNDAFNYCTKLEEINLPNAIETIGEKAFYQCFLLDSQHVGLDLPSSLKSIGDSAFRYCQNLTYIVFNEGLETIGAYSFANTGLRRAQPRSSTITSIGDGAFSGCDVLEYVTFGSGLKTLGTDILSKSVSRIAVYDNPNFSYGDNSSVIYNKDKTEIYLYAPSSSATSYTIPDTVTTIKSTAFSSCVNLKTLKFGTNVTKIEANAFKDFTLDSVYFYGNETKWNAMSIGSGNGTLTSAARYYMEAGTLGESITYEFNATTGDLVITGGGFAMNDYTAATSPFAGDERLKSVTINGTVQSIGDYLFTGCSNLKTVKFTESDPILYIIGSYAFAGTSLESFVIPSTCYKIKDNAFYNCSELKSVTLPAKLNDFGKYVFTSCPKLESLTIGENSSKYEVVDGVMFANDKQEITYYLANKTDKEYTIPDSVNTIAEYAFYDAKNLEKVTIPLGIEVISKNAFANCTNLKEIVIPWTVTKVCADAFNGDANLKDVYYSGAKIRWDTITIESGNTALTAATFHSTHTHVSTGEAKMVTDGKDGTHRYKCSCGEYCDPSAHVWDSGSVTTYPTHFDFGVRTFTCICGATYTAPEPKSTSHQYDFVTVYPTCTEQGYTVATCPCGDTYTCDFVEPNGHHYEKGVCTECGANKKDENNNSECDCMCHNESGFVQFFYKIARFFWKIFKINQTCSCGAVHY